MEKESQIFQNLIWKKLMNLVNNVFLILQIIYNYLYDISQENTRVRSCRLRRYRNTTIHLSAWLPLNPNSNSISPLGTLTALWETLKNEANFSWTYCSNWNVSSFFAPPANVSVLNCVWGMSFWRRLGVWTLKQSLFLPVLGLKY